MTDKYKFNQISVPVGPISAEMASALERARLRNEQEAAHDMKYGSLTESHGPCEVCERRERDRKLRAEMCDECGRPYADKSLCDEFAIAALAGLVPLPWSFSDDNSKLAKCVSDIAQTAYAIAYAMMRERAK